MILFMKFSFIHLIQLYPTAASMWPSRRFFAAQFRFSLW